MKNAIVPEYPTSDMVNASYLILVNKGMKDQDAKNTVVEIYRTMLGFSPPPIRQGYLITPFQAKVHEAITDYMDEHGYSPTLDELSKILKVWKSGISRACKQLVDRQVIERRGRSWRGLKLIVRPGEAVKISRKAKPFSPDVEKARAVLRAKGKA